MRKIGTNPLLPFSYVDIMYITTAEKKASGVVGRTSRGRCNRRVNDGCTLSSHSSVPALDLGRDRSVDTRDARQQEADEIAESRIEIRSTGFSVLSQSGTGRYTVQLDPGSCECDDLQLRGKPCKHILGILAVLVLRASLYSWTQGAEQEPDSPLGHLWLNRPFFLLRASI